MKRARLPVVQGCSSTSKRLRDNKPTACSGITITAGYANVAVRV